MPLLHPVLLTGPDRHLEPLLSAAYLSDEPGRIELPELRQLTAGLGALTDVWRPIIQHRADKRWYSRLLLSATVEVWLIGWYPGQQTDVHDHGGALGALTVVEGSVAEDRFDREWQLTAVRSHGLGASVGFGAAHVHRVANRGAGLATTIHAYSPPELPMRYGPLSPADAKPAEAQSAQARSVDARSVDAQPAGSVLPAARMATSSTSLAAASAQPPVSAGR